MQNKFRNDTKALALTTLCLLLPVLLLGIDRSMRSNHDHNQVEEPINENVGPIARTNPGRVAVSTEATPQSEPEHPWWESISSLEAARRRADFDYMYGRPGAYPEFSEIVRQLQDAGVPVDLVQLESREIFGALLQRETFGTTAGELEVDSRRAGDSELMQEMNLRVAATFREKAGTAEAEVCTRLVTHHVPLDSTAAVRILQLTPTTPLRPLSYADVAAVDAPFGPGGQPGASK